MSMASGEKTALKMTACTESNGVVSAPSASAKSVSLLINPASLTHKRETTYSDVAAMGDTGTGRKFNQMAPNTLTFDVVFDGTGVVPRPTASTMPQEVGDQIQAMSDVIYAYNGTKHEPSIVQVLWGSFIFYGRLTSFSTDYSLFKPSGAPLRAKVSLAFESYMSAQEEKKSAAANSPDLSHLVEVRAGDSLPLLCHQIYGDSRYYMEVARFNGLNQFRNLPPGLKLHFPPLE